MIAAIRTRMAAKIPDLAGRIDGAAEFAAALERDTLPQADFFAYVIPAGAQGTAPTAMAGLFVQPVRRQIAVLLGFRSHSPTAERALGDIRTRIDQAVAAICGWAPADDIPGVFELQSEALFGFRKGAVFYQLQFAITDRLEVTP